MLNEGSKVLDIVLIGTGISGLNFIDKYTEKKKILHVISPKDDLKKFQKNVILFIAFSNERKI